MQSNELIRILEFANLLPAFIGFVYYAMLIESMLLL